MHQVSTLLVSRVLKSFHSLSPFRNSTRCAWSFIHPSIICVGSLFLWQVKHNVKRLQLFVGLIVFKMYLLDVNYMANEMRGDNIYSTSFPLWRRMSKRKLLPTAFQFPIRKNIFSPSSQQRFFKVYLLPIRDTKTHVCILHGIGLTEWTVSDLQKRGDQFRLTRRKIKLCSEYEGQCLQCY